MRRLQLFLTVSVILALAACDREPGSLLADESTVRSAGEVRVFNWADYLDPDLLQEFEAESGIKVRYDTFDSNEVLEARLLAGKSGFDVVVPSANFLERQIAAGVFRPLDRDALSNTKNLDPELNAMLARHDADNRHAVGYMWGTTGIAYDSVKLGSRTAGLDIGSWALVYDPASLARVADCGVAFVDAPSEVIATVLVYLGKDPNAPSAADLAAVEALLVKIRPSVRYINSVKPIEDLANGEICLVVGWSGDAVQARARSIEAQSPVDIRYVIPREGTVSWLDALAIPADAPNVANAHRFIDFMLRADVAARNASFVGYATVNEAALPQVDPVLRSDAGIYPPPEVRARLRPMLARDQAQARAETRIWTRFRTGT
jgi:putrescine transport system substrate-binding protein